MSERHIELTWRCSSCKHQNLGRHMACQGCGNPKDASEEYEMPANAAAVASVEDPRHLAMARAGAHWKCQYCSSEQRALDGGCAQCGAGRAHGANAVPLRPAMVAAPVAKRSSSKMLFVALGAGLGVMMLLGGVVWATRRRASPLPAVVAAPPPKNQWLGKVASATFKRTIVVDRWALAAHEGFTTAVPASALDVKDAGMHFHHNEEVFDHDETVYDEVQVPDGVKTETYSERVACGQDCTTTPKSCRQQCTNQKNGFASCKDVCTGGEQRCTTKYCNETRTKTTPKTRTERRPRTVKKYRTVAKNAPWSTWKEWEWVRHSAYEAESGAWPDAGAPLDAGALPDGGPRPGSEREHRSETMSVTIILEDGQTRTYVPQNEREFGSLPVGTVVNVTMTPSGMSVAPSSLHEQQAGPDR